MEQGLQEHGMLVGCVSLSILAQGHSLEILYPYSCLPEMLKLGY